MKKKILQLGKSLSRTEMKAISGGLTNIIRWSCYEGGNVTQAFINCRAVDPTPYCGYDFCTAIGYCTAASNCS